LRIASGGGGEAGNAGPVPEALGVEPAGRCLEPTPH